MIESASSQQHEDEDRTLAELLEHEKESSELTASGEGGIDGSSIQISTATTTTPTAATAQQDSNSSGSGSNTLSQEEYELQFPLLTTSNPTTSTSIFSSSADGTPMNIFSPSQIPLQRHYLRTSITGQLWLDMDQNGKRGSYTNSTLNALEVDSGLTGVDAITLVDCETNTEVGVTKSRPVRNDGSVVVQRATETGGVAGAYTFPEALSRPGRYYVVFKAPTGFRVNTNALPLDITKEVTNEDGMLSYFECPFGGGEGEEYFEEAVRNGEWDAGGYCGRTVGCFEVGRRGEMEEKFVDLVVEESGGDAEDMVVVYPSEHMLDVGLTEQSWPLKTQQYADIEVDLLFPETSTEAVYTSLEDVLGSEQALAEDETVASIQRSLLESVVSMEEFEGVQFVVEGVTMSTVQEHEKVSEEKSGGEIFSRYLRSSSSSRKLQEESSSSSYAVVTYKFTAHGQYNPPPRLQLGEITEESINADSRRLTKDLQDKIGNVFTELQTVNSKHMTIKGYEDSVAFDDSAAGGEIRPPPMDTLNAQNAESRGLASWATAPIILLSVLISGLIGLFFFRRAFHRRKDVHCKEDFKKSGDKKKKKKCDHVVDDDMAKGYADEEEAAAKKRKEDPMDSLVAAAADKAEDVPANLASSGTDGSSGNSEERNEDELEQRRRRKKPRSRKSRAQEFASSIKRSLTLQKEDSVMSDISDHEEKRRKRKKAKEEARRRESERGGNDEEDGYESRSSSKRTSSKRSNKSSSRKMSDKPRSRRSNHHSDDVEE